MNFFEAQEFFKKLYPEKQVIFSFDKNCIRLIETVWTEGLPNPWHHIHYFKVKISVEGLADQYLPISPHTENCCLKDLKWHIETADDVHLPPQQIEQMKSMSEQDLEDNIAGIMLLTGVDKSKILSKLN